jgi:hypothetical protein
MLAISSISSPMKPDYETRQQLFIDSRTGRFIGLGLVILAVVFAACDPAVDSPPVVIDPTVESIALPGSQVPNTASEIAVTSVVSREKGWLVLLRDNGSGAPGAEVLGHLAIDSGVSRNRSVKFDRAVTNGERVWAMLYRDSGTVGTFESSSVDRPAIAKNGLEVITSTTIRWLSGEDQILEDNIVTIDTVRSTRPAWIVVYASDLSGNPTVIIGKTHIDAGTSTRLKVQLDTAARVAVIDGDRLWTVMHLDDGSTGTFEPAVDLPAFFFNTPIRYRFRIGAAVDPVVDVANQAITASGVVLSRVEATKVGWIVIRESNTDGTANMAASIGRARVSIGINTNIRVALQKQVPAGTKLWAVLHEDTGSLGKYEYTTGSGGGVVDVPILAGGVPVAKAFTIE